METLNAKLSSPIMKASPKMKRRSLSIGHESEYDYDLNESISSGKTISSNLNNSNGENKSFSLQQSFMRLVQTNYAKITRSPELTRKFLTNSNSNSNQCTNSLNQAAGSSPLMNNSYNGTLSNNLLGAEVAKEVASIAIKKKQNSYPTSCGAYEILNNLQNSNNCLKAKQLQQQESTYNSTTTTANTTTIKVDSQLNKNDADALQKVPNQEICQPVQNLQLKSTTAPNLATNPQQANNQQRRCSQPAMGIKVMKQQNQQPPNQLTLNQPLNQPINQSLNQQQQINQNQQFNQLPQDTFKMQNANEKASFLSKLETKLSPLSPTRDLNKQIKNKNEFEYQIAARVETWLNKSSPEEENRESLLDQIRKGTKLKKVELKNDRSAPKIV